MTIRKFNWVVAVALVAFTDVSALTLEPIIATNLVSPTFVASPPGDDRLFVSERSGAIKVFDNSGNFLSTFVTLANVDTTQDSDQVSQLVPRPGTDDGVIQSIYFDHGALKERSLSHNIN